jgi:chromosome segregation ATPase
MAKTSPKPIVATYVEWLAAQDDKRRAASRAEKEREAQARENAIRNNSELASQRRLTLTEASEVNASSSSLPRRREQDAAEIDGRAVPASSSHHSNVDLPPTPRQSRTKSLSEATSPHIRALESQLASQNTRIDELEAERNGLTRQVAELRARRDEAERALSEANAAGGAARTEREEVVTALRRQIASLIEDRERAEREIEELKATERALRWGLDEERERVRRLEAERRPLERSDGAVAAPAVAASTMEVSSRRASVGESERRPHGHRRKQSSGLSINFGLEVKRVDDKEKKEKEKKKKGSHK